MRSLRSTPAKPFAATEGIVLTDLSLKPIAFDRGAADILLNGGPEESGKAGTAIKVPREILYALAGCDAANLADVRIQLQIAGNVYRCRTYLLEVLNGVLRQQMVAIHIHKDSSIDNLNVLNEVKDEYRLTTREVEVLKGISLGLTTQELADRMCICPSTVKSFLRLITKKMGVTTRAAMVGKLLAHGESSRAAE